MRPRLIASIQLCCVSGPVTVRERAIGPGGGSSQTSEKLSVPPVAGNAEAGIQQTVIEVRRAELVGVERADVVVVAEAEREVERDERRGGVSRRRAAPMYTDA